MPWRDLPPRYRLRLVVNLLNGSTAFGLAAALAGGASRPDRGPDGLLLATGYRPPLPPAAFTVGNVIIVNRRRPGLLDSPAILAHEARHATQYAWCAGVAMLPLYFAAAGLSWLLCADTDAWNVFERGAGLADGGYADRPLRPWVSRALTRAKPRRRPGRAAPAGPAGAAPGPAAPGGSTSIPSR